MASIPSLTAYVVLGWSDILLYQGRQDFDGISTSKDPESYNYYNLSNFESSKGGPNINKKYLYNNLRENS